MVARFATQASSNELLTCTISNQILEPFFGKSPTEMRKLNKDKATKSLAAELVKEGGIKVTTSLKAPSTYECRLVDPATGGSVGDTPVLELMRRIE